MPRVSADSGTNEVTDIALTPRNPVSAPPVRKSFDQMLRDGYIFLADGRLRKALGPDFDVRSRRIEGFCVELTRNNGHWMGYAWEACNHRMILYANDSQYTGPRKQGSTWLFESGGGSIRIATNPGALSVTVFDPESESWSTPVEVRPSESPHDRSSRWHRDAEQAFLEQASAGEPLLVERRHGQWDYQHQALRSCSLHAWDCQEANPILACEHGHGDHLLIRGAGGSFTFEHVSGVLERGKCVRGPFSGLRLSSFPDRGSFVD
jgi:hypothetical protein